MQGQSLIALTATPKNKTLEIFGRPLPPVDGKVFVLDFMNDTDTIQAAFADYYPTTFRKTGSESTLNGQRRRKPTPFGQRLAR